MSISISIITVCYNAEHTINRCIKSVVAQNHPHMEYIVIDGKSTDNTWAIISDYAHFITKKISEPDKGLYDAINKGIKMAGGDIIGLVHADDVLADENVLADVAREFAQDDTVDVVYGDLDFYNPDGKLTRIWRSGGYVHSKLAKGWMPPHPTFYMRRKYFEKYGLYDAAYGSAADYELMLRFLYTHRLKAQYIDKTLVNMQTGGISNKSFFNRLKANIADFKAIKTHAIKYPLWCLFQKITRKIKQLKIV